MSLQCFYKLGVITYFNLNREYIAEVLCINKEEPMAECHGQCFLKKNLNMNEESAADGQEVPPTRQPVEFPLFLVSEPRYQFDATSRIADPNFHYSQKESVGHPDVPFRPPTFLS